MPLRARLAVLFTIAATVLAVIGGYIFNTQLGNGLRQATDDNLRTRAETFTAAIKDATNQGPDFPDASTSNGPGDFLIQVLNPAGASVNAGPIAENERLLDAHQTELIHRNQSILITTDRHQQPVRLLALPVPTSVGIWTVVLAQPLKEQRELLDRVRAGLYIADAAVVFLAALGSWALAGAALRPVERMRQSASEISASDASGRVTVPHTRDELAALGTTFNELLDRLALALARQRRLVADAGHELRSPLAILRGELELASRGDRSREDLAAAVSLASAEATRLATLVDDLLFLARSDDGALQVSRSTVQLAAMLRELSSAYVRRANECGVTITVAAHEDLEARIDPARIRHALVNLIDNALRASGPGDNIELAAHVAAEVLTLEVNDQGPGFPETFLPQAFERFTRPDHARPEDDGGSGLGLAIVRAVAQAHGGDAHAGNREPLPGASVRITLPHTR